MALLSKPISARVVDDINVTLDRLRYARQLDPNHDLSIGDHSLCDLCMNERRLNWLLDTKIPRKATR